jgi:DNA-directed RNA polymerase subunit H (RpoH/RPB5)
MYFEKIDIHFRPARIVKDNEKLDVLYSYNQIYKTYITKISVNDELSIKLGAKIDDIICMRNNNNNDIYRLVI